MIDLRKAFRSELDELEKVAVLVPAPQLAERVGRTLSARRRARTIHMAGAFAAVVTVAIVVGLGAWRAGSVEMTSGIAREPVSPPPQPNIPTASAAPPATEAIRTTTEPAKNNTHSAPRAPDRAEPTTPRYREKPSAEDADQVLERALSARGRGDLKTATDLLESLRTAHPGTSQAAIAAAYLGRDAARSGQHDAARRWFETYLREQPSGPLEREASGQLIELTTGSEQTERARVYLEKHPNGAHAPLAKRVLAGPR